MRKVIEGKMYDTDTASQVGAFVDDEDPREQYHVTEYLFRKKTGEFFLHVHGGAFTKYRIRIKGCEVSEGEKIIPLNEEQARKWAEEHMTGDEYEAVFGPVAE